MLSERVPMHTEHASYQLCIFELRLSAALLFGASVSHMAFI